MADTFTVRDDISSCGLRRLHLLRSGEAVDKAEIMARYGIQKDQVQAWLEYEEEDIRIWHLRMYWRENDGEDEV